MDGNGRWALARGLPREAGHRAGVECVSRIVEAAPAAGIGILTLFAFSSDNWRRPRAEVAALSDRIVEQHLFRGTILLPPFGRVALAYGFGQSVPIIG